MYSSVTSIDEPVEKKTSVMKKIAVVGLFMGCMAMAFVAGTKYTQYNHVSTSVNADPVFGADGKEIIASLPFQPEADDAPMVHTGMLGIDEGPGFDMDPKVPTDGQRGKRANQYLWIIANAKDAFEGILKDPNDPIHWDTVAKAYCNVVKMYCAYKPQCNEDDGCRPTVVRDEWLLFCNEGDLEETTEKNADGTDKVVTKPGPSMKDQACKHLDYVNGPGCPGTGCDTYTLR